jgi:Uma2 family endonuclease
LRRDVKHRSDAQGGDRRGSSGHPRGGWWFATEVEIELELEPNEVYRPDAVGWRRERLPELPEETPATMRPDWVCEVLSPSNKRNDTVRKRRVYHRCGVPHYWIVDPIEETIDVYRWHADGYLQVLAAERGDRVRPEPFDAVELSVGMLFGDDEDSGG